MRFKNVIDRPDLLGFYAKERVNQVATLLRAKRAGPLVLYALSAVFGQRVCEIYSARLSQKSGSTIHKREVGDHWMFLDVTDLGISRTLFVYGVHEEQPTAVFRRELAAIRDQVERPIVIDVGANLGYYALIEAATIGENGTVYATEPVPETRSLLEISRPCALIVRK